MRRLGPNQLRTLRWALTRLGGRPAELHGDATAGGLLLPADLPLHTLSDGPLRVRSGAILGVAAHYHDSAACLVREGEVLAAAQEERFTRRKHDRSFPRNAIEWCLRHAGLSAGDVDLVAYYEEPLLKADRVAAVLQVLSEGTVGPSLDTGLGSLWLALQSREQMAALGYSGPFCFVKHHVAHLMSAYGVAGFDTAAGVVIDGVGEWATATIARVDRSSVELLAESRYPHSIGLLYSAVTAHLGFQVNADEYKVMGLATYGLPRYRGALSRLCHVNADGSVTMDRAAALRITGDQHGVSDVLRESCRLAARNAGEAITGEHADLAASVQSLLEEAVAGLVCEARRRAGSTRVVMAGGVGLNGVATYRAYRRCGVDDIFIQPAAGDAGAALGAALYAHVFVTGGAGQPCRFSVHLGPAFTDDEIAGRLQAIGASPERVAEDRLLGEAADRLHREQVIGWFQGPMEFGPRALGARSILASPRDARMRDRLNRAVKYREPFRPFAPTILEAHAQRYIDGPLPRPLEYMLMVVPGTLRARDELAAAVHADGSLRPQVLPGGDSRFHQLIDAYHRRSGVPAVLNTSFNVSGEPIVCTPEDAYRTFIRADLDVLIAGNCIVSNRRS
jgi:carbamoyltransferase